MSSIQLLTNLAENIHRYEQHGDIDWNYAANGPVLIERLGPWTDLSSHDKFNEDENRQIAASIFRLLSHLAKISSQFFDMLESVGFLVSEAIRAVLMNESTALSPAAIYYLAVCSDDGDNSKFRNSLSQHPQFKQLIHRSVGFVIENLTGDKLKMANAILFLHRLFSTSDSCKTNAFNNLSEIHKRELIRSLVILIRRGSKPGSCDDKEVFNSRMLAIAAGMLLPVLVNLEPNRLVPVFEQIPNIKKDERIDFAFERVLNEAR